MKHKLLIIFAFALITAACGRVTKEKAESVNNNTNHINEVVIEYDSPEAKNAPDYDPSVINFGPLSLIETLNPYVTPVNMDDVGGDKIGDKIRYVVSVQNIVTDTIKIVKIQLPSSYFTAEWPGRTEYMPGLIGGLDLYADSAIEVKDFKFILTYEGDRYKPQVFHVNLHPNVWELKARKESSIQH